MRIAIITNTDNGKGLQRDAAILSEQFERLGHTVTPIHFQRASTPPRRSFDLTVFLEVGGKRESRFHDCAPVRWLIPNPEWWEPGDDLAVFDRILCKTQDAERIFRGLAPDPGRQVAFLGFTSAMPHEPAPGRTVTRERCCLHIAGGSTMKGTQAVLDAWRDDPTLPPLVVCTSIRDQFRWPRDATHAMCANRVGADRLAMLQAVYIWHVQPSEYEGFGHVLHEGRAAGAVVVTTAAPPMNEPAGVMPWVRTSSVRPLKSARVWGVSSAAVGEAVHRAVSMSDAEIADAGVIAVEAWRADRGAFVDALAREVEGV